MCAFVRMLETTNLLKNPQKNSKKFSNSGKNPEFLFFGVILLLMEAVMDINEIVNVINLKFQDKVTGYHFEHIPHSTKVIFTFNDNFDFIKDTGRVRELIKMGAPEFSLDVNIAEHNICLII